MTLENLLDVLSKSVAITVGTENGNGWVAYQNAMDGEKMGDMESYLDRAVTWVYPREKRHRGRTCCRLEEGLAIIVEGDEDGAI